MSVVGYASGVFDMFHVGHLNILRRARLECDYLIAGVTTDDACERIKGKRPVVPLHERMEIVQNIRFVDQAVPDDTEDKINMWYALQFDVMFKGNDWEGTERGDRMVAQFAEVGVKVIFLPYTPETSSTMLRDVITSRAEV
jgi:glycerol-3-phosphate cytidylyltransferase